MASTATQLPAKMQAIGINQTGDFEVIEKLELTVPQNAPGNVLVKVRSSACSNAALRGQTCGELVE